MDAKYEAMEKRIEVLESELMDKTTETEQLKATSNKTENTVQELTKQIESMNINRRINTLILRCENFGKRTNEENIEDKVIQKLARRFPDIKITNQDIQTVHRLQGDYTVICKFVKTSMKNQLYERRLDMARKSRESGRSLVPLFISESLTAANQQIFNYLLDEKRKGTIYTVFTRRGLVHVKTAFNDRSRLVDTMNEARDVTRGLSSASLGERAGRPPAEGGPPPGRPGRGGARSGPPRAGHAPGPLCPDHRGPVAGSRPGPAAAADQRDRQPGPLSTETRPGPPQAAALRDPPEPSPAASPRVPVTAQQGGAERSDAESRPDRGESAGGAGDRPTDV